MLPKLSSEQLQKGESRILFDIVPSTVLYRRTNSTNTAKSDFCFLSCKRDVVELPLVNPEFAYLFPLNLTYLFPLKLLPDFSFFAVSKSVSPAPGEAIEADKITDCTRSD